MRFVPKSTQFLEDKKHQNFVLVKTYKSEASICKHLKYKQYQSHQVWLSFEQSSQLTFFMKQPVMLRLFLTATSSTYNNHLYTL